MLCEKKTKMNVPQGYNDVKANFKTQNNTQIPRRKYTKILIGVALELAVLVIILGNLKVFLLR